MTKLRNDNLLDSDGICIMVTFGHKHALLDDSGPIIIV